MAFDGLSQINILSPFFPLYLSGLVNTELEYGIIRPIIFFLVFLWWRQSLTASLQSDDVIVDDLFWNNKLSVRQTVIWYFNILFLWCQLAVKCQRCQRCQPLPLLSTLSSPGRWSLMMMSALPQYPTMSVKSVKISVFTCHFDAQCRLSCWHSKTP